MGGMSKIRSTAARVLSTGDATTDESRKLAAYVLSDDKHVPPAGSATNPEPAVRTRYTESDLKRILQASKGQPGYKQREEAIHVELERMRRV